MHRDNKNDYHLQMGIVGFAGCPKKPMRRDALSRFTSRRHAAEDHLGTVGCCNHRRARFWSLPVVVTPQFSDPRASHRAEARRRSIGVTPKDFPAPASLSL